MTHKEAVDLITSQPIRVEIELIESADGSIPYDITTDDKDMPNMDVGVTYILIV